MKQQVENFHVIHVTYHNPTNTKPGRLKLKSLRFHEYIWLSRADNDYWYNDAVDWLIENGFDITGQAEYPGNGMLFFTRTFKSLKK